MAKSCRAAGASGIPSMGKVQDRHAGSDGGTAAETISGQEHWTTQRRREAFPLGEMRRRSGQGQGHRAVRARLVDGLAADLRLAGAGPAGFLGDGLVRQARLRHLVRRTAKATAVPPRTATTTPIFPAAPTISRRRATISAKLRGAEAAPRLRHFVRRAEGRAVRAAQSGDGRPPGARRHGLDRRRQPDPRRAQEEAAGIPVQEPPADRQGFRAFDLHPRSSRHRRG